MFLNQAIRIAIPLKRKKNHRPPAPDFRRPVNPNAISGHWDTPLRPKCKQFDAFSGHGKKKKRWGPRPHPEIGACQVFFSLHEREGSLIISSGGVDPVWEKRVLGARLVHGCTAARNGANGSTFPSRGHGCVDLEDVAESHPLDVVSRHFEQARPRSIAAKRALQPAPPCTPASLDRWLFAAFPAHCASSPGHGCADLD